MKNAIPWPKSPDHINPALLDDIASRVSAALSLDKKREKDHIITLINNIIAEHYRRETWQE